MKKKIIRIDLMPCKYIRIICHKGTYLDYNKI